MGDEKGVQRPLIRLKVNGEERLLEGPLPLTLFLQQLGLQTSFVAVALNGEVLRREEYPGVLLKDGDVLEVVRPVGGG